MHRIGLAFLLIAIGPSASNTPQTRWSRQIYNTRIPVLRERRQFSVGDWIPLTQPCPTCRPLTDPAEGGSKTENIGLTPPKLPRQIQATNFFPQDDSSFLSVPPPPSNFNGRHPNQFQNFFQFNNPNPFPPQQFFPPTQQPQFLPQTYLTNQGLLLNNNPQAPLLFNNPNVVVGQENANQSQEKKVAKPNSGAKEQKAPENVVLEQNKQVAQPVTRLELPLPNAPAQFFNHQQQQQLVNFNPAESFLVPPPNKNGTVPQNIEIPGLEKEEIQLLYVPVETLRQRGHLQQIQQEQRQQQQQQQQKVPEIYQTLPQNVLFNNQQFVPHPLNQNLVRPAGQLGGHYITQAPAAPPQQTTTLKQAAITPPTLVLHSLPVEQTAQPFASASPDARTTQFATASPLTQEYSPLTTENEPERVVTIPARNQSPQTTSGFFPSTPKPVSNHLSSKEPFQNDIYNDKALTDQKQAFLQNHQFQFKQFDDQPQFSSLIQTQSTTEIPVTTTLAPHQPPLSVFMGGSRDGEVDVVDVLRALKDAKTIPVLDHFTRNTPRVFVGPANLTPPKGYGKFELPYLSNIDTNRVERKIERFPFFVAPLNFNPPPGYSKIPFPAPHIGSVVVSSESAMRSALLHEKASTPSSVVDEYNYSSSLPELNPELPGLINELELEAQTTTTPAPETTTAQRVRSRRPNNVYRPPGRRPIPNSRLRTTTTKPEAEDPAEKVQSAEILKEVDGNEKRERFRTNYLKRGRQRVKTTTESVPENHQTEATLTENTYLSYDNQQQTQRSDAIDAQPRPEDQTFFGQAQQNDFLTNPFAQINDPALEEARKEVQGIFEVQNQPDFLTINNNGNSGFYDHSQIPLTESPISSTQFFEHSSTFGSSTQEPQREESLQTTKNSEETSTEQTVEIPKQNFRQNLPNVPGVKSVPNPSSVKTKSSVRSRPRGRLTFATSQTTESTTTRRLSDDEDQDQRQSTESTSSRPASRYNQYYRGNRKPLRTTTESSKETEPETKTSAHTLRPLRRSSIRTSVSTKRIRKPTTPLPSEAGSDEYDSTDASFGRKSEPDYSPSGVSNDVYDDQVGHSSNKPKSKKKYSYLDSDGAGEGRGSTAATPITTKTYQSRKDDNAEDETRSKPQDTKTTYPEWNPSESGLDISGISLTTQPSTSEEGAEGSEERKKQESNKKAFDPELEKKVILQIQIFLDKYLINRCL